MVEGYNAVFYCKPFKKRPVGFAFVAGWGRFSIKEEPIQV